MARQTDRQQKAEPVSEIIDCRVRLVSSAVVAGSSARSLASAKHGATDISGSLTNSVLIGDLEEDTHVYRGIMSCM